MMIGLLLAALLLGACGGDDTPDPPTYDQCASDTQAWVRNAYLAIVGQRPHSQAEVDVYVALHDQIVAMNDETLDAKAIVARAMMQEPGYRAHWTSHFMDALRVPRIDDQEMSRCYDASTGGGASPTLASYVRDNAASAGGGVGGFTMKDLISSSLMLDDVSPIYRGHLFALVAFPIPAANVPPVQAELARREDFGNVFDSSYLNRDMVCLECHNSETSVTDSADPATDRHWPMAGLFEKALYGMSNGIEHERAHAAFRFDGFTADPFGGGTRQPWGWSSDCGSFYQSVDVDPAAIDGKFGKLSGERLTVYDLEGSLHGGFDSLRGGALTVGADGQITDPDQAFAYLTSATIVEGVWKEVVGSGLTIANYFPRNEASRDQLQSLTDRFIASKYSLSDLLIAIVSSDYFSRALPEAACGEGPYTYPNVYDPWVISDSDEARRLNGPADSIAAISARTLMRTAYGALEWPVPSDFDFPQDPNGGFPFGSRKRTAGPRLDGGGEELSFQQGTGAFLKNGERGFRGLDFQARLVWEDRFGACAKPFSGQDYVDNLVTAAGADSTTTVGDVVSALKDRLIGEPAVEPDEATALATLYGTTDLSAPASSVTDLAGKTRQLCGVLLSSPQFVLSGAAGRGGDEPKLTPSAWQFGTVCNAVKGRIADVVVTCTDGALTAAAPAP